MSRAGRFFWLGALLLTRSAVAAPPPVLTPATTEQVRQTFEELRPEIRYERISVDRDHLVARLCTASTGRCFTLRLDPPDAGCQTESRAAFCISFPEEAPAPEARALIVHALEARFPGQAWAAAADDRDQPKPDARLTLILLGLPLLLGVLAGLALRSRQEGAVGFAAGILLPALLLNAANIAHPVLGIWDVTAIAAVFSLGMIAARRLTRWRPALISFAVVLFGLVLVEFATRARLPRLPPFSASGLLLAEDGATLQPGEAICQITYGHGGGQLKRLNRYIHTPEDSPPGTRANRMLHLGDSMVFGVGVEEQEPFTADLERMEADTSHVNGGVPATGPDQYLAALFGWTTRQRFDRVVMYLFAGNDLDLDAASPCCEWKPILQYSDGHAALHCATPSAQTGLLGRWRKLAHQSRPPLLLTFLSRYSQAAAYAAVGAFSGTAESDGSGRYDRLATILRTAAETCREKGIAFTVVVLPDRAALEGRTTSTREIGERMVAVSRELGIQTLDATELLASAVQEQKPVFLNEIPHDFHLSPQGHQLLAEWLHAQLARLP